jgi:hypothetical protein
MALDPAGIRIERMREALEVMRALGRKSASLRGVCTTPCVMRSVIVFPSNRQRSLSVGGGRRILTIAASEADIVGINPDLRFEGSAPRVTEEILPDKWDARVRRVQEAAGDRFNSLELQTQVFMTRVKPDCARPRKRPRIGSACPPA